MEFKTIVKLRRPDIKCRKDKTTGEYVINLGQIKDSIVIVSHRSAHGAWRQAWFHLEGH